MFLVLFASTFYQSNFQSFMQFVNMKGTLRHYSLIPLGGGGILAHTLAHIASGLKVFMQ